MKTPFELEEKFHAWFDANKIVAFLTAIIAGIITHLSLIAMQLVCADGLMFSIRYEGSEGEMTIGRWGLALIGRFWPDREAHAAVVPLCILYAAVCAILVIDMLQIKSRFTSFLIGLSFVCAPAFTILLYYSFTAAKYCFAMLLSVAAAWIVWKLKRWYSIPAAAVLLMLSLSIYQGYIGMFTGLAVAITLKHLLNKDEEVKEKISSLKIFAQFVASAVLGMILYLISLKIMCKMFDLVVTYGNAASFTPSYIVKNFFSAIGKSYQDFFAYFFADGIVKNTAWHRDDIFACIGILILINIVILLIQNFSKKNWWVVAVAAVLTLLLPVAINSVDVITMGNGIYQLTAMPLILAAIFGLALAEMTDFKFVLKLLPWGEMAFVSLMLTTYIFASIFSHMYMRMQYDRITTIANRAMDRVETTEGYEPGMRIAFFGTPSMELYGLDDSYKEYDLGDIADFGIFHEGLWAAVYQSWGKVLIKYMGTAYPYADVGTAAAIYGSPEFQEMECFPDKDSVQIINDVVVVKFSL